MQYSCCLGVVAVVMAIVVVRWAAWVAVTGTVRWCVQLWGTWQHGI